MCELLSDGFAHRCGGSDVLPHVLNSVRVGDRQPE